MSIRRVIVLLSLAALASCGELIEGPPPEQRTPNNEYGWSTGSGAVLQNSDGSVRTIAVTNDGGNSYLIDSSQSGVDTLHLDTHGDSILVRGLSGRTFLPLPTGGRITVDSDITTTSYPATAFVGEPDTLFFASGKALLVYDPQSDAVSVRWTFPSDVRILERSFSPSLTTWYAITADDHLWSSTDHGRSWTDGGAVGGHVTAAEASPFSTIYVATDAGEIRRFDGSKWTTPFTLSPARQVNCLKYFSFGPNWTLFAGTEDGFVLTLPSSGAQKADAMIANGNPIPIMGIALDFGGGHDRIWAAGRGAVFAGRNFGQQWKAVDGLSSDARSIASFGDVVLLGTQDGKIVKLHEDDAPQIDLVASAPITAIGAAFGETQIIAGTSIYSSSKLRPWHSITTSIRTAQAHPRPWVFLTKDTVWHAADIDVAGVKYTYTGRILDRAHEIKLHGKSHRDILVVRYAVESGSGSTLQVKDDVIPMYVVYFEVKHGPVRIEVLQKDHPTLVEEVE